MTDHTDPLDRTFELYRRTVVGKLSELSHDSYEIERAFQKITFSLIGAMLALGAMLLIFP